jgi:hypothetical protein
MKSHTVVANGARSGSMRCRFQRGTSWPFFDCNAGAGPAKPAWPWQPEHPFAIKTCAPSLAVPWPRREFLSLRADVDIRGADFFRGRCAPYAVRRIAAILIATVSL